METEAEALNGEATDSRRMEVQIGGAVTLECDGGCWGHGPGMDPVGGPGPLALSRVVYQEAGEYRCVAPDRKMQDTWRAQLPYHVKVTGKCNEISCAESLFFFFFLFPCPPDDRLYSSESSPLRSTPRLTVRSFPLIDIFPPPPLSLVRMRSCISDAHASRGVSGGSIFPSATSELNGREIIRNSIRRSSAMYVRELQIEL